MRENLVLAAAPGVESASIEEGGLGEDPRAVRHDLTSLEAKLDETNGSDK